MVMIRTDSVISRQIVHAFFDFLRSVEAAPGVDLEALEVAKDCLTQVFQHNQLPQTDRPQPDLLLNLFTQQQTSTSQNHASSTHSSPSPIPKDELFGLFFHALEKIHFFTATPNGDDDNVLLDRATSLFHDALNEIERSDSMLFDRKSLADALKILGNKAMQSNLYSDAIERYTCAIALRENNAVYYCNRAAAYTQMNKYNEAITDCLKSIEIDPSYSKAYSRMGLAYYAQGKYSDAINKGFRKALELDPDNGAVKENIRVAEQKLIEEREHRHQYQNQGYNFGGGSGVEGAASAFGSLPANIASMFSNLSGNAAENQSRAGEDNSGTHGAHYVDGNNVPADLASMVENIARTFRGHACDEHSRPSSASATFEAGTIPSDLAGMFRNMSGQNGDQSSSSGIGGSDEPGPGIGNGASFSFNFGGETPEELTRAFSSVTGMFSGAGRSQEDPPPPPHGRPDST